MASPQSTQVPGWLNTMRTLTGLKEASGSADNPQILAMADSIAQRYPEMASYCAQYNHDSIAWCGLATAYCCAMNGIRPPFGATDTDKFLWAQSFADDPGFTPLDAPRVGCIVVMTREGGGHVTLYESTSGSSYSCRGGNQSDMINVSNYSKSSVIALLWPNDGGPVPPAERRELEWGDTGSDVAEVQRILGLPEDGDFGPMTHNAVYSFQAAADLDDVDGVVGQDTWAALDELNLRMVNGSDGLTDGEIQQILAIAQESPVVSYSWRDRGRAPLGYVCGMALCYGLAVRWLMEDNPAAHTMAKADRNNAETDALTWLANEFEDADMDNSEDGVDTLRHLFVLLMGLGMRESSGRHCEGRDMSASNVEADTAEAGLFQTSWNISTADKDIPVLMDVYSDDPNGFRPVFAEGVTPTAADWSGYGRGDGARYQWLAKYSPAFTTMVTGLGLRKRRQHWGPVNRKEVELLNDVDDLFLDVQDIIRALPPEPVPVPEMAEVNITVSANGPVKVIINGQTVIE